MPAQRSSDGAGGRSCHRIARRRGSATRRRCPPTGRGSGGRRSARCDRTCSRTALAWRRVVAAARSGRRRSGARHECPRDDLARSLRRSARPRPAPAGSPFTRRRSSAPFALRGASADPELRPHRVDARLDLRRSSRHLRPLARVPLFRPLARAVDADLAAEERLVRAVVELVDRPVDERRGRASGRGWRAAARRPRPTFCTSTSSSTTQMTFENDICPEPQRPWAMRRAWIRVLLLDRDEDEVVERPLDREVHVDDLGEEHRRSGRKSRSVALPSQASSIGGGPTSVAG